MIGLIVRIGVVVGLLAYLVGKDVGVRLMGVLVGEAVELGRVVGLALVGRRVLVGCRLGNWGLARDGKKVGCGIGLGVGDEEGVLEGRLDG